MTSAKTLLEHVLHAYNDKSLDLAGAEVLRPYRGSSSMRRGRSRKTSAADLLWGQALNVDADLQATLDKHVQSLALARQAKDAALVAHASRSERARSRCRSLYDASIRVGNALSNMGKARYQEALQEYDEAVGVAAKIASSSRDERATPTSSTRI